MDNMTAKQAFKLFCELANITISESGTDITIERHLNESMCGYHNMSFEFNDDESLRDFGAY